MTLPSDILLELQAIRIGLQFHLDSIFADAPDLLQIAKAQVVVEKPVFNPPRGLDAILTSISAQEEALLPDDDYSDEPPTPTYPSSKTPSPDAKGTEGSNEFQQASALFRKWTPGAGKR